MDAAKYENVEKRINKDDNIAWTKKDSFPTSTT